MKRYVGFLLGTIVFLAIAGWAFRAQPAPQPRPATTPLQELVAAAGREGTLEFYATNVLAPEGAKDLEQAFNAKYGLNIRVNYTPVTGSMAENVGKLISQIAAGSPPDYDVVVVHDQYWPLFLERGMLPGYDFAGKLGVDPKAVRFGQGAVAVANQIILPIYDTQRVRPEDVPKAWEDLLDPKWSGGKIVVPISAHHWARLAQVWGEEKTKAFLQALMKQKPAIARIPEAYTKVQLGEVAISAVMVDDFIAQAEKTGAPVAMALQVQPIIITTYYAGSLKGARHPNLARLFQVFLATPEGQRVWEKYTGQSSIYAKGSGTWKKVQGKKVVVLAEEYMPTLQRLTTEYSKLLGVR